MGAQDTFSVALRQASLQWLLILLSVTDKALISHSAMRKTFLAMSYWQNLPSSGSCQGAASQECALPLPILLVSNQEDQWLACVRCFSLVQSMWVGGGEGLIL